MKEVKAFSSKKDLLDFINSDPALVKVTREYPFRVTSHLFHYIDGPGSPIWRQFVPSSEELLEDDGLDDPLGEEHLSPATNLIHRYQDRVLWLVTSACAAFCRFCTRKRIWNRRIVTNNSVINEAVNYIAAHGKVRDVILSGGDSFLIPAKKLEEILKGLRNIKHVAIIRMGTRLPIVHPKGVTTDKLILLQKYQPIFVMLHVNHPVELSPETVRLINHMADLGIPMASQTVLLKGVNDSFEVLKELFLSLLSLRVRPYYLLQMDVVKGTYHFRVPLSKGLQIMMNLRHNLSGLAMPHYMLDLPGGGGKIELTPSFVVKIDDEKIFFKDRSGKISWYPLVDDESDKVKSVLGVNL